MTKRIAFATDLRGTDLTRLSPFNYRGVRLLPSRWQQSK